MQKRGSYKFQFAVIAKLNITIQGRTVLKAVLYLSRKPIDRRTITVECRCRFDVILEPDLLIFFQMLPEQPQVLRGPHPSGLNSSGLLPGRTFLLPAAL